MTKPRAFVWCTYRTWSFRVLEGLLDVDGWRCGLVVTTPHCSHDLSRLTAAGVPVMRVEPKTGLKSAAECYEAIRALAPAAIFHYGWSWIVPAELCGLCPNVTLHPGRLPEGRGGSPIQNQIRQGWKWTDANLIELSPGLDEGPIYASRRISLEGNEADDVWARMINAGTLLSRRFLRELAAGTARAVPQAGGNPIVFKRVRTEDARLDPTTQAARFMADVIRAHNETDANSYVRPAWLSLGGRDLVIERASLTKPQSALMEWTELAAGGEEAFEFCHRVNNGALALRIAGADGNCVYATRVYIRVVTTGADE